MRIGLELDDDVVRITLMADDETAAERTYDMLARQLEAGRIDFSFRDYQGNLPTLERLQ